MATDNPSNAAADANANVKDNENDAEQSPNHEPLPLPPPPADSKATELDVSTGEAIKLDHLGPMVVNRDGTLSRITNWDKMTEIERQNTLRILGKRNQLRRETLQAAEDTKQTAK